MNFNLISSINLSNCSKFSLSISGNLLFNLLNAVYGVVGRKNFISSLNNIVLIAKDSKIAVFATNMHIISYKYLELNTIKEEGVVIIVGDLIHDIVKKITECRDRDKIINLEVANNTLNITSERANFSIGLGDFESFPKIDNYDFEDICRIRNKDLLTLFSKVSFFVHNDDIKVTLSGIMLEVTESGIKCVATDGHRIGLLSCPGERIDKLNSRFIIPKRSIREVSKFLTEDAGFVDLSFSSGKIKFSFSSGYIISKLIDGDFPDYNKIIPQEFTGFKKASALVDDLRIAIDRVSLLSNDQGKAIKLSFKQDVLFIFSTSINVNNANESIDIAYTFEDVEIGFNSRYLLDLLSTFDAKEVHIYIKSNTDAVLFIDSSNPSGRFIVMPMRV